MDVRKDEETGTWEAVCDRFGCGGFTTRNHPTKKAAQERMEQHHAEHDEGLQPTTEEG
jgi:hypothetical protein